MVWLMFTVNFGLMDSSQESIRDKMHIRGFGMTTRMVKAQGSLKESQYYVYGKESTSVLVKNKCSWRRKD